MGCSTKRSIAGSTVISWKGAIAENDQIQLRQYVGGTENGNYKVPVFGAYCCVGLHPVLSGYGHSFGWATAAIWSGNKESLVGDRIEGLWSKASITLSTCFLFKLNLKKYSFKYMWSYQVSATDLLLGQFCSHYQREIPNSLCFPRSTGSAQTVSTLSHFLNGPFTIAVYTPFTAFHTTLFTLLLPWYSFNCTWSVNEPEKSVD